MTNQGFDSLYYNKRARQIKIRVPALLTQWGLQPRFKRWRLAQDPETGLVVLFGVLDNQYIATHTITPFSDYFDPRLLNDLAEELHVQVLPSEQDGLRYAFVLEGGRLESIPPSLDVLNLFPVSLHPTIPEQAEPGDNRSLFCQQYDSFLKLIRSAGAPPDCISRPQPDILFMDDTEFARQIKDFKANRVIRNLQTSTCVS